MVERGDEDPTCAALKSVLSEMVASETTDEASRDIFDVEDSLEDADIAESECCSIVGEDVENCVNSGLHQQKVGAGISGEYWESLWKNYIVQYMYLVPFHR